MQNFLDMCEIDKPVVQAGMAGGITTPEMVAAVAETGALGTIGAGYMNGPDLKNIIHSTKELTNKPFAVNVFAVNLEAWSDDAGAMQTFLETYRKTLGIAPGERSVKIQDYLAEKIDVIIEEAIPIVTTAFGVLPPEMIARLKRHDVVLIGMATTLGEASELEEAGYDAIVAQGVEAGGHRGTFDVNTYSFGSQISLHVLLQELLNTVNVPVIAAGGIYHKSQVEALLTMGASAVQIGTRFLMAAEAGTNTAYRQALIRADTHDTVITKVFSGRPARAIRNQFVDEVEASGIAPLPFPIQNQLTKPIRSVGKTKGIPDMQSLWAGQGVGAIRQEERAAEIVQSLV
ncbi:nitronate monooxygenase [Barrientosiimonas marina]|uniref:Probable nitronate monooxygenase n=1 Tax=Lentibacillus kimchii TaxID=1542911 RepID=A0ABW2UXC5_9BACI